MLPFFVEQFGNPHSRTHLYGWQSEEAVDLARKRVADLIGADAKEIIFTSVRVATRAPRAAPAPLTIAPRREPPRATTWPSRALLSSTVTASAT